MLPASLLKNTTAPAIAPAVRPTTATDSSATATIFARLSESRVLTSGART